MFIKFLHRIGAEAGLFNQELPQYWEKNKLSYIVGARLTGWLKLEAARVEKWRALAEVYAVSPGPTAKASPGSPAEPPPIYDGSCC